MGAFSECPICQMAMILPMSVPGCNHKFCFLCLKGVACRTSAFLCPMCRGPIDRNIFNRPSMLDVPLDLSDPEPLEGTGPITNSMVAKESPSVLLCKGIDSMGDARDILKNKQLKLESNSVFWLYEGRNGWWRFDPRQENDIEHGLKSGMAKVEIIICGHAYIIDFTQMIQYRRDIGCSRSRAIKRVDQDEFRAMSASVKGISGVRTASM